MDAALFNEFKQQGAWALLFVFLLIFVLRENKKREEASQKREDASKEREDKLIGIVEEQGANLTRLTASYEQLTNNVKELAHMIDSSNSNPRRFTK